MKIPALYPSILRTYVTPGMSQLVEKQTTKAENNLTHLLTPTNDPNEKKILPSKPKFQIQTNKVTPSNNHKKTLMRKRNQPPQPCFPNQISL